MSSEPSPEAGGRSPIVYLAGPLFTQGEREWNARVANGLREAGVAVILPQERAQDLIAPGEPLPVRGLYEAAIGGVREADLVVAVLDGADPDSGTSFECGYAHALGTPIIGVRTDLRLGGDDSQFNVNLMLSQACSAFVLGVSDDVEDVVADIVTAIGELCANRTNQIGNP